MNILINPFEFSISNIFFLDVKDNIIMNGKFIKFIYSTDWITLNGLFLDFPVTGLEQNIYNGRKYLFFKKEIYEKNEKLIYEIERIESNILDLFLEFQKSNHRNHREILNKNKVLIIYNQLKNGMIKYYNYSEKSSLNPKYYMKISGIWETATEFGLTYKLIQY